MRLSTALFPKITDAGPQLPATIEMAHSLLEQGHGGYNTNVSYGRRR